MGPGKPFSVGSMRRWSRSVPFPEICKSKPYTSSVTKMFQRLKVKVGLVVVVVRANVPLVFLCSQPMHFHTFYKPQFLRISH